MCKRFWVSFCSGFTPWNTRKANSTGFTLVELLLVVALIGLLSTFAIYSITTARMRSRDTRRVNDISQIRNGLDLYFGSHNSYPVTSGSVVLGGASASVLSDSGFAAQSSGTLYMGNIPANMRPGGADYIYYSTSIDGLACTVGSCANYIITFSLEGGINRLSPGAHTADNGSIL